MTRNYGLPPKLQKELKRKQRRLQDYMIEGALLATVGILILIVALLFFASSGRSQANPNSWIPLSCCWTTGACEDVREGELRHLPGDGNWQVVATGEVISRTDYSPDGSFKRCASTYENGRWERRPDSRTRCLFEPRPSS